MLRKRGSLFSRESPVELLERVAHPARKALFARCRRHPRWNLGAVTWPPASDRRATADGSPGLLPNLLTTEPLSYAREKAMSDTNKFGGTKASKINLSPESVRAVAYYLFHLSLGSIRPKRQIWRQPVRCIPYIACKDIFSAPLHGDRNMRRFAGRRRGPTPNLG